MQRAQAAHAEAADVQASLMLWLGAGGSNQAFLTHDADLKEVQVAVGRVVHLLSAAEYLQDKCSHISSAATPGGVLFEVTNPAESTVQSRWRKDAPGGDM